MEHVYNAQDSSISARNNASQSTPTAKITTLKTASVLIATVVILFVMDYVRQVTILIARLTLMVDVCNVILVFT